MCGCSSGAGRVAGFCEPEDERSGSTAEAAGLPDAQ